MKYTPSFFGSACVILLSNLSVNAQAKTDPDHAAKMQAGLEIFKSNIRPMFLKNCLECHGGKSTKADVDLSTREALVKSEMLGKSGESSSLYKVVAHLEEPYMPHKAAKLPDAEIALLKKWIDLGAPYDKPLIDGKQPGKKGIVVTDSDRNYWAFRKLQTPAVPSVKEASWLKNPIDSFLLSAMEQHGLKPLAAIDRRGLIRRVYFDLIGLPPEPQEVQAFVDAKDFASAYQGIVEKLLNSPQYGERWARHWLDVARYGESHGFEHDYDRPYAFHYRDFAIKALNQDMPYDQFLRWQLAGDEFAPQDPLALAATGFLAAGVYPTQITNREAERVRYDAMDDMLSTTGSAMLGLTIGCARCHDHKYDPIPSADYYHLLSAFTTTVRAEIDWDFGTDEEKKAMADFETRMKALVAARTKYETEEVSKKLPAWIKEHVEKGDAKTLLSKAGPEFKLEGIAAKFPKEVRGAIPKLTKPEEQSILQWLKSQDTRWQQLNSEANSFQKKKPKETRSKMQICSEGVPPMRHHTATGDIPDFYPKTYLLARGDVDQKTQEMDLGVLQVLSKNGEVVSPSKPQNAKTSFKRAGLANWLTNPQNGAGNLAARVMVNRVWHYHFGRGLVATINDFGIQGEKPSHPELLEWLADDFIQHGWQIKRLHKMIVLSHAYQIGNTGHEANAKIDPENKYLSYHPPRRMEAEIIRDNLLAVSGQLDRTMFGPGTLDEGMKRRSIYFQIKRSRLIPMLQVFDWPDTLTSGGVRPTTVIAPQALVFLNNPHVRNYAAAFGQKLKSTAQEDTELAVQLAYKIAFSRLPSAEEQKAGAAFLNSAQGDGSKLDRALTDYALVLMSLNEFIFVN
ncbi:PSD1 domain-containing protein [Telmatocola sphagniphila]|uniref:PSD1 domain-containing protein n=1 Tax=Telmatocola sphagniphila TaxID=1123043 RepID=A0A8E6B6X7_9BACT|nr:PSD1 and planctomycete cytochrome C domain-containing protein [Telmatocola sphagniphila]QVL33240.1 PSD1 domain-containing protein [Telmatocola sphagniphila]